MMNGTGKVPASSTLQDTQTSHHVVLHFSLEVRAKKRGNHLQLHDEQEFVNPKVCFSPQVSGGYYCLPQGYH